LLPIVRGKGVLVLVEREKREGDRKRVRGREGERE
jgi:hypothetical protein